MTNSAGQAGKAGKVGSNDADLASPFHRACSLGIRRYLDAALHDGLSHGSS